MADEGYPRAERSTLNRLAKRGHYDYKTIHTIIDATPILHVSFNGSPSDGEDAFPTILPMLGCTAPPDGNTPVPEPVSVVPDSFSEEEEDPTLKEARIIYLHGHAASRLMQLPKNSTKGVPLCIAASTMNGVVLALTPFHHSCNYASAVVHGYAHVVDNEVERNRAMHLITNNVVTQRWESSRSPPTKAELQSTGILRVEIVSASAKVRTGGPGDDRHDLKNEQLVANTWTGVVPAWLTYGEPVQSEYNEVSRVPGYLAQWIKTENDRNRRIAEEAAIPVAKR